MLRSETGRLDSRDSVILKVAGKPDADSEADADDAPECATVRAAHMRTVRRADGGVDIAHPPPLALTPSRAPRRDGLRPRRSCADSGRGEGHKLAAAA